jgi:VanZ family protein
MTPPDPVLRRLVLRIAFAVVLAVLLYAGLREQPVPELFHEEDKLHHVLGFAVLAVSMRMAFPRGRLRWQLPALLALAAGIELVQKLMPERTGSVWDLLAGAFGVTLGLALALLPALRRFAVGAVGD